MEYAVLAALVVLAGVAVSWHVTVRRRVFDIRIRNGVPFLRRGKVTPAFVAELADVLNRNGVRRGGMGQKGQSGGLGSRLIPASAPVSKRMVHAVQFDGPSPCQLRLEFRIVGPSRIDYYSLILNFKSPMGSVSEKGRDDRQSSWPPRNARRKFRGVVGGGGVFGRDSQKRNSSASPAIRPRTLEGPERSSSRLQRQTGIS